jgi:DNA-binding LacI/PurR family transcriptional regulator
MAGRMAELLLEHIQEPDRQVTSAVFDPELVVRASA